MQTRNDLDEVNAITVRLKAGMAWALYSDTGPEGPCGQSMRTTCAHSYLHVWNTEHEMRAAMDRGGVVGDWTRGGVFGVVLHDNEKGGA